MAIKEFEAGKWYYYGGKDRDNVFKDCPEKQRVLDREPHLCTFAASRTADFDVTGGDNDRGWDWSKCMEDWNLVPDWDPDKYEWIGTEEKTEGKTVQAGDEFLPGNGTGWQTAASLGWIGQTMTDAIFRGDYWPCRRPKKQLQSQYQSNPEIVSDSSGKKWRKLMDGEIIAKGDVLINEGETPLTDGNPFPCDSSIGEKNELVGPSSVWRPVENEYIEYNIPLRMFYTLSGCFGSIDSHDDSAIETKSATRAKVLGFLKKYSEEELK